MDRPKFMTRDCSSITLGFHFDHRAAAKVNVEHNPQINTLELVHVHRAVGGVCLRQSGE